jgi:hypothetical protein
MELDQDVKAMKICVKALSKSSSVRMLRANLQFIWDHCFSTQYIDTYFPIGKKKTRCADRGRQIKSPTENPQ